MQKIIPRVQDYPWGSTQWIPEFLGLPVTEGKPWAELWYGAHPKAPSLLEGKEVDLLQYLASDPENLLGSRVVRTFGPQLPFLLKLLAAVEPLSIQCHPSRPQAEEGYLRENQLGIPLDSVQRNYRDPNHKPEILLALHPCAALCGFRTPSSLREQFQRLISMVPPLKDFSPVLEEGNLAQFYRSFFSLPRHTLGSWIQACKSYLQEKISVSSPEDRWFCRLAERYPEDPGCFAPYYLNLVELSPGEGLFLEAGVLHAYLRGFGVELMANSDNVLRGGLTSKHMDVEELLRVVRFEPTTPKVIRPVRKRIDTRVGECWEEQYPVSVSEFSLSVLRTDGAGEGIPLPISGPEILLCGEGLWEVRRESASEGISLKRGEACFLDATVSRVFLTGKVGGSEPMDSSNPSLFRARIGVHG